MRTPIAHPLPVLGSILVHKSDGSTVLLPASSECFDPYEINAVRKLIDLVPIEGEPESLTLARMQKEVVRSSVAIRSTPGFMDCGYESVEIESKDERIVRLEQANSALTKWKNLTTPIVDQDYEVANMDGEIIDKIEAFRVQICRSERGEVVSPNGCEVVR